MTTITERWGFNEAERTSEDIEQMADFLMTHKTVPLKLVNLMIEGKTEMSYWDRMSMGTAAVGFLLFYKAPLIRTLTAFPRLAVAGAIAGAAYLRLHQFRENMWQKRVMFCYKRYIMTKNLHPRKQI